MPNDENTRNTGNTRNAGNTTRAVEVPQQPGHPVPARGRPDAVSLVFGAVFLGITAGWLLTWFGVLPVTSLGWFLPVLLIIAGLLGVLVSRRRD